MKKLFIFLLLGFLLFSLLGYFCVYKISAPAIEIDIKHKVQDSLARNDFQSIQVTTNGRDITLQGIVSSEQLKDKAQRVAAVEGYHIIDNKIVVMQASLKPNAVIDPYTMTIRLKEDQSIVLSGFVPNVMEKNKLLSLANSHYGKPHVTDALSLKAKAPFNWQKMLVSVLNSLSHLKQGQAKILNNKLELTGVTESEELRQKIGKYLENNLPKNYTGSLDIVIISNNASDVATTGSNHQLTENCRNNFKDLLSKNKIHFKIGKAVIAKDSFKLLNELVLVAMGCTKQMMTVEGYTDSHGSEKNNKEISQQRAQAVVNYLQQKGGAVHNLNAKGYGEERPVATNKTPKGRALNRRIEFTIEGVK